MRSGVMVGGRECRSWGPLQIKVWERGPGEWKAAWELGGLAGWKELQKLGPQQLGNWGPGMSEDVGETGSK